MFSDKCTDVYAPPVEVGIAWYDPDIGIIRPLRRQHPSDKDAALPRLKDIDPSKLLRTADYPA